MIKIMLHQYSGYFHTNKFDLHSSYYLIILQEVRVAERE